MTTLTTPPYRLKKNTIKVRMSDYAVPRPSCMTYGNDKYGRLYIWDAWQHDTPKEVKDAENMAFLYPLCSALAIGLIVFIIASSATV